MRTLIRMLANVMIMLMPTMAAAQVAKEDGGGLVVWLFLGFGALIIVFQLFPGLALFAVMLKEIFSRVPGKNPLTSAEIVKRKH